MKSITEYCETYWLFHDVKLGTAQPSELGGSDLAGHFCDLIARTEAGTKEKVFGS